MKPRVENLTFEKFREIYSNKKLRNTVAYAHARYDSNVEFKYYKALCYPKEYIVSQEQINEAKKVLQDDKNKILNSLNNDLVFVGMGMTYDKRFDDDVCNHRIRTSFVNVKNKKCFIEFSRRDKDNCTYSFSVDFAIINYETKEEEYNYRNLEREQFTEKYTKENLLKIVNEYFDCNFKELKIDNYTLSPNDFVCVSPKK